MNDISIRLEKAKRDLAVAEYSQNKYKTELSRIVDELFSTVSNFSDESKVLYEKSFPFLAELTKEDFNNLNYDELMELNKKTTLKLQQLMSYVEEKLK